MRELHVVSVSDDGGHVVLAGGAEGEEFLVPLDDRLRALVQADADRKAALSPAPAAPAPSAPPAPPAVPAAPAAPRSSVTPKQIQARLRAGETVEEIAASAGMPVAKVERFAWPVVSEQERMISGTRAAVLVRPRRGPSVLPIGDAVAEHLQDLGLPADETTWTARREESGRWLVQVSFVAKSRTRTAGWRYEPSTREVSPVDPYSTALGYADAPVSHSEGEATAGGRSGRKAGAAAARPAAPRAGTPKAARQAATTPAAATPVKAPAAKAPAGKAPAAKADRAGGAATPSQALPGSTVRAAQPPAGGRPSPQTRVAKPAPVAGPTPARTPGRTTRSVSPAPRPQAPAAATTPAPESGPSGPPMLRVVRPPAAAGPASVAERADDTAGPDTAATGTAGSDTAATDASGLAAPAPASTEPAATGRDTEPATQPAATTPATAPDTQAAPAPAPAPAPARRAAGGRASVPAWADVLLGTAPVHRPADRDRTGRD